MDFVLNRKCLLQKEVVMLVGKTIDAFFNRKRGDSAECKADEPTSTEAIPVQPSHEPHPSMPQQQGHQTQTNEVQFRGIEFLQRDPALRPHISQYPPNL